MVITAGRALVRVDASPAIGFGHLVRTLALADELARRAWDITFACHEADPKVRMMVADHGHGLLPLESEDTSEVAEIARLVPMTAHRAPYDWLILDHYGRDGAWLAQASTLADRRLVIDDLADRSLPADLVVNADPAATAAGYADLADGARLLLGPRFALLGNAFAELHLADAARSFGQVNEVLISFGGSDPLGMTAPALEVVRETLPKAKVSVAIGPGYQFDARDLARPLVTVLREPEDLPRRMADADLAIGAAGTSVWERCAVGLPSVMVISAINQLANARALEDAGAALVIRGDIRSDSGPLASAIRDLAADDAQRQAMSVAGRALVDGLGAVRVADHLEGVRIRSAQPSDEDLLWRWANDPQTRANSLTTEAIPLATHRRWFRERLTGPDCILLIGENGAGPIGQVRFDLSGREATVSISVARGHRGGGIGDVLLASAVRELAAGDRADTIRAVVRPGNRASIELFARAGFAASRINGRTDEVIVEMRRRIADQDRLVLASGARR
ncbi:MAG TPA: UDP-2,4-diacetamido-2,4,6-trideoxy-beta-L-altropyranose hydrolase [Candidatus Limnocylindrales bacterium]|nr:UDP-2,4-diacetamido-2,4,6-trideoxy-beta-L-altropyranose hydrolase [Candidatus Limnocylindrales bacterium]